LSTVGACDLSAARIADIDESFAAADVDAFALGIDEKVVDVTAGADIGDQSSALLRERSSRGEERCLTAQG
jgi:hypothetical protein